MTVALTMTYHDPEGRLYDQFARNLPALQAIFSGLAVCASPVASQKSLEFMRANGIVVQQETSNESGLHLLGKARRESLELGLQFDAAFIIHCDCDRALHWVEFYPDELAQVAAQIAEHDFTVLGRTPRAYESHPRVQRDTEIVVNQVYAIVSGNAWDVTAAARGLSRRAAEAIVSGCHDNAISTDVTWSLHIKRGGRFSLGYIETEGLEFETGDRYPDEIKAAGGYSQWLAQMDANPRTWAFRLELARIEVEGMIPYSK